MSSLVTINDVSIEQLIYKDTPVVTFAQVAEVHGISVETVRDSFKRHSKRFVDGKHYFRLDFTEANQLVVRQPVSQNGLIVLTQKGYLLLTKPMRDSKSWEVQERMIDEYFSLRTVGYSMTYHNPQTAMLIETLQRLDAYEKEQANQRLEMLAIQAKTIEAQELALSALRNQQWVTIRQYVAMYDLAAQISPKEQHAYANFLGKHCFEKGMPMYKAFTADVSWPDEKTYHAGTIQETIGGWIARQHAQPALAIVAKKETGDE